MADWNPKGVPVVFVDRGVVVHNLRRRAFPAEAASLLDPLAPHYLCAERKGERMRRIACLSILVLAVLGLGAQESGAGPDIGTVDVTAQVYSPLILAPAGSVTVVTAADIATAGASSAADALAAVPDLTLSSHGPGGGQATVSIGASSASQVLVIMDGVRLNDPLQGAPDLNQIPAAIIEKIEVLQGGASAAYGADAVGGVIVITTKKSGQRRLSLGVSDTAYPTAVGLGGASSVVDSQKFTVDAGSKLGLADVAVSAQAERGANAYDYAVGGSSALRANAQFWNAAGNLSLGLPFAGGRLAATVMGSHQETGVPGSTDNWPNYLTPSDTQTSTALRGSLGWANDALAGGFLSLDLLGRGGYQRTDYSSSSSSTYYQIVTSGIDLRGSDALAPFCTLGFGVSALYDAANSPDFATRAAGQPTRISLGSYIEPTFLLGDRLKLTPSIRYDWNDTYTAGISEMLGAVYRASGALDLRLSGGRSFRAPTFEDLYDYYYSSAPGYWYLYTGNPDLKPETSYSGELGLDFKVERFSASTTVDVRYVEDMITYDTTYFDPLTYSASATEINLGRVFIPGAELSLKYAVGPATLGAGYEFVYPLDLSGGTSIADSPVIDTFSQHKVHASADFAFGAASAGMTADYSSGHVDAATPTQSLSGVLLLGLRGSLTVAQGTTLTLNVDNLLDRRYQVIYGYPMPGLTMKLGMRVDL